jgi:trigger factor
VAQVFSPVPSRDDTDVRRHRLNPPLTVRDDSVSCGFHFFHSGATASGSFSNSLTQYTLVTITTEDISPTRKAVTLTVPADTIAGYEKTILKEISGQVRLSGFRPGKAPAALVKRQFAKQIGEELQSKAVSEGFKYIGAETKLKIYGLVDIKGADALTSASDATLRFELDLVPEFELPEYKGLELPDNALGITDEEVQTAIDGLRSQHARYEVVERAAEKGDFVKLSYAGTIDGTAVKDIAPDAYLYGTQSATWEEVGAEDTPGIPEIVAGLAGKKTGDKAEFTHEFPADFAVEALKGKKATYAVEVFEVRAKILPELDETFFQSVKVKDVEELRSQVRDGLFARKENEARAKKRQDALEQLGAKLDFALPESAVDTETYNIFLEYANLQLRQGVDVKEIEGNRDTILNDAKDAAKLRVKTQFILSKIAEAESLKVSREEFSSRIAQDAYMARTPVEKYAKELSKDRKRLEETQRQVLFNKTLDFIVDNAKK